MQKSKKLLSSLDLFSGIGGIAHALSDVARPVAYCDIDKHACAVLQDNMKRGLLPTAPICKDVRLFDKKWLKQHCGGAVRVDLVTAGFPCVGFSIAGSKSGLEQWESKLFYQVVRIVDVFKPKLVFFENVPNILKHEDIKIVVQEIASRGYDMRWCITSAADAGAPQLRKRWFCIARKPSYKYKPPNNLAPKFVWKATEMPPRTSNLISKSEARRRYSLLGNAVCPDAVRIAFSRLCAEPLDYTHSRTYATEGAVIRGKLCTVQSQSATDSISKLPIVVTLLPGAFRAAKPPSTQIKSGLLQGPRRLQAWGTPAHKVLGPANYLTNRNACMLETQVRFEASTPDMARVYPINPIFVEWLMGYPADWTRGYDSTR